jgi:hypothetical protein
MPQFIYSLLMVLCLAGCSNAEKEQNQTEQTQNGSNGQDHPTSGKQAKRDSPSPKNTTSNRYQKPFADDLLLDSVAITKPPKQPYRQIRGSGMPFVVKIPQSWKIRNKPPAGDGYTFKVGRGKADARVYVEKQKGQPGGLAPPDCHQKQPFRFRRQQGIKCHGEKALYYYLSEGDQRLVFYIKAGKRWQESHADQLDRIARSLAFKTGEAVSALMGYQ